MLNALVLATTLAATAPASSYHARNLHGYQTQLSAGAINRAARLHSGLPGYTVHNHTQTLDHFNYQIDKVSTFDQRYLLINAANYSNGSNTPIFFFTGAEGGNVEDVLWAYTFMVNVAMELNAMVVCMEHRFFGLSVPFNNNVTEALLPRADRVGLLSMEQSLADYAQIISSIRDEFTAWKAPVVTFGGSLAGTLASFMRLRYPQLVDIAVASSAPVRGYPGLMDKFAWHKQVTDNYEQLAPGCPQLVRRAFAAALATWPSKAVVAKTFKTCENATNSLVSSGMIEQIMWQRVEGWGEFIYPQSRSNRTTVGPACRRMAAAAKKLDAARATATPPHSQRAASAAAEGDKGQVSGLPWDAEILIALINGGPSSSSELGFLQPTAAAQPQKQQKCLNLTAFEAQYVTTPASRAWDYLSCTEIVHPIGSNNKTDMFPPYNWTVHDSQLQCDGHWGGDSWGVTMRPQAIPTQFGTVNVARFSRLPSSTSKIIFSYGLSDPWHTGGILYPLAVDTELNSQTLVVAIPGGTHCADMAPPAQDDTPAMLQARTRIKAKLLSWLQEHTLQL